MDRTACTETQCLYKGDLYLYFYILRILTKERTVNELFCPTEFEINTTLCPTANVLLQQVLSRDSQGPFYLLNATRLVLKHKLTQILRM
jgi:hypothetical protein